MELRTFSILEVLCGFELKGVRVGLSLEYMPEVIWWEVCPDARSSANERDSTSRLGWREAKGVGDRVCRKSQTTNQLL